MSKEVKVEFKELFARHTLLMLVFNGFSAGLYSLFVVENQNKSLKEKTGFEINEVLFRIFEVFILISAVVGLFGYIGVSVNENVPMVSWIGWGFSIWYGLTLRNHLNSYYGLDSDSKYYFSGLWAVLFGWLYINYKIRGNIEESGVSGNAVTTEEGDDSENEKKLNLTKRT